MSKTELKRLARNRSIFTRTGNWIWANTDSITKWLQVIALIVTASWVYFKFRTTEAGALETPAFVSTTLHGDWRNDPAPGSCWIDFNVTIRNDGLTTFEVASTQLSVWRIDPMEQPDTFTFVDLSKIEQTDVLTQKSPASILIDKFPTKTARQADFTWVYAKMPHEGLYVFKATALDVSGKTLGSAASWTDRLCRNQTSNTK